MKKTTLLKEKENTGSNAQLLLCLYLGGAALRFLLALAFRHGATVIIDESLYINIAKSLAQEGSIAYRSQPVPYLYIFYPLLLSPLYLIRLPFDIYRAVQLENALLMALCVFPVFRFAQEFTASRKKAVLCAFFILLMPDMAMAGYLMSECVVWPLTLWAVLSAYRLFCTKEKQLKNAVLTGVFTALLFWTKPGSLTVGAVMLILAAVTGAVQKNRSLLRASLAGIGVLVGMIVCFYLLYVFFFGYEMSLLGLYNKQLTHVNAKWLVAVAESSFLELMLLAIACGGVFAVLPFACLREYPPKQRVFITAFAAGVAATAIGTAALVVMYKWNESLTNMQLHLRYMAMFVPVLFVLSQPVLERKVPGTKALILPLLVMAALYIFPGASIGSVYKESTSIDSMALSAFYRQTAWGNVAGWVLIAFSVCFLLAICMELGGKKPLDLTRPCLAFFAVCLLYNGFWAYSLSADIHIDPVFGADALEVNAWVEEEEHEVLGITQQFYNDIYTYWLETRVRKPMQQVTVDNIIYEAAQNGGVYVPFVPVDQAPNVGNGLTPDTDVFLLGATIAEHLELNENVSSQTTSNGVYTLVHINKGELWADSMLFGLNQNALEEGKEAYLNLFNPELYPAGEIPLTFTAFSEEKDVSLTLKAGETEKTFALSSQPEEYSIVLPLSGVSFTANGGTVQILSYSTRDDGTDAS